MKRRKHYNRMENKKEIRIMAVTKLTMNTVNYNTDTTY